MSGQASDFLQEEAEEAEVWLLILPTLENWIFATRSLNSRADWQASENKSLFSAPSAASGKN
jgi:hypothetical protein